MKITFKDIKEIKRKLKKGVVIISYPLCWGGAFTDHFWMSEIIGEHGADDYNPKEYLIADAERNNQKWVVIRYHKNGKISIMDTNIKKLKTEKVMEGK